MNFLFSFIITALLTTSLAFSATRDNVSMPEKVKINKRELVLNGLGTRKATWLGVKVYVGGIYLSEKSNNGAEILKMKNPKYLRMHFLRDVRAENLVEVWNQSFENAIGKMGVSRLKKKIGKLTSYMGNILKNEEIVLTFLENTTEIEFAKKKKITVKGKDFGVALLSTWFINPTDKNLRDGLLGIIKSY